MVNAVKQDEEVAARFVAAVGLLPSAGVVVATPNGFLVWTYGRWAGRRPRKFEGRPVTWKVLDERCRPHGGDYDR